MEAVNERDRELVRQAMRDHVERRLRARRLERGWTLEELAAMAGVSRSTLSRLERTGRGADATRVAVEAALGR